MPTGYTAAVVDGEITELKPFVMQLARGMGALVMMRDDPHDAPIPKRFEPSNYHYNVVNKAVDELIKLEAMTPEEKQQATDEWNFFNQKSRREAVERNEKIRLRLNNMLEKVAAWQGAPEGIKEFALQQLNSTLDFDVMDDPLKYYENDRTVEEWYTAELKRINWDLKYHREEHEKELERTQSRNEWLAQLRVSLEKE